MSDAILINGNQTSWSSTSLRVNGEPFFGFTGLTYADKREYVLTYGMGRHHGPRGRTAGKYTPDPLVLKGPKASVQSLRQMLALLSPDQQSYGNVIVPIVLQYIEAEEQQTVEFDRCRWQSSKADDEESPEALIEEVEFSVMRIRRNGLVLFDNTEGLV